MVLRSTFLFDVVLPLTWSSFMVQSRLQDDRSHEDLLADQILNYNRLLPSQPFRMFTTHRMQSPAFISWNAVLMLARG